MRTYLEFLSFGILFVGIQEFWVSYIWRGDAQGFILAVLIVEIPFLTLAF